MMVLGPLIFADRLSARRATWRNLIIAAHLTEYIRYCM